MKKKLRKPKEKKPDNQVVEETSIEELLEQSETRSYHACAGENAARKQARKYPEPE